MNIDAVLWCIESVNLLLNKLYVMQIEAVECWEDSIDNIVMAFENKHKRKLLYSISFY